MCAKLAGASRGWDARADCFRQATRTSLPAGPAPHSVLLLAQVAKALRTNREALR